MLFVNLSNYVFLCCLLFSSFAFTQEIHFSEQRDQAILIHVINDTDDKVDKVILKTGAAQFFVCTMLHKITNGIWCQFIWPYQGRFTWFQSHNPCQRLNRAKSTRCRLLKHLIKRLLLINRHSIQSHESLKLPSGLRDALFSL